MRVPTVERLGCPLLVERCCCLGHDLPLAAPGEEGWRGEEGGQGVWLPRVVHGGRWWERKEGGREEGREEGREGGRLSTKQNRLKAIKFYLMCI